MGRKENYKLISLLNIDMEVHSNILSNQQPIKRIIHCDQTGFMPEIQGKLSTCKSVNTHTSTK